MTHPHILPCVARLLWIAALLLGMLGVPGQPVRVAQAAANDCNIMWGDVLHDTFNPDYRSIVGPTTPNTTVKMRLRVAQSDLTSARVRVWNDRANTETYYTMSWDGAFDTDPATYDWWFVDIPVGSQPTILYYFFELNDILGQCTDQDFYVDDDVKFYGGGYGAMNDVYTDARSFQLTVYDPAFSVPAWMQRGVVYQIFPDRFRDGNAANNPSAGRFSYNQAGGTIVRSNQSDWNYTVCDPRSTYSPSCSGKYGDNFYGGDLAGITAKINQGYFDNLGVSVLYLNPIFRSPSNHKYDTADFLMIDPDFGSLADFQALTAAAHAHGLKVMLDGVFNHTSSDSKYFDRYGRFDAAGNLIDPDGGTFDGSGACEAVASAFRAWFYFSDAFTIFNPGTDGGVPALCADNPPGRTYEAWYGYSSLPKLQANSSAVRNLIWANGTNSVGPYWVSQGADGWRFDVGGDVDPGVTSDPTNDYWEGFRSAVRSLKSDTLMLGEEWGDASAWLLGNEWDSVMNYRFRSAVLSWLFTGCSGGGCTGGTNFEDNDSNASSSSGSIGYSSPSQFNARLRSIQEDYPPAAFKAMLNLEGSHDTNRVRFLLKKINNDNDAAAVQRLKEWWLFAFTYAGAPMLYYGDEIGLNHDGVWSSNKWEDDPYNRIPFPWPDASGSTYGYGSGNDLGNNAANAGLLDFARKMASLRWSYRALQDGDVQHGLIIDDGSRLYGFARTTGSQTALIALNRDGAQHTANFTGLNAAPYNLANGTVLYDAIEGNTYTVSSGAVSVPVNSTWGVVLLEQDKIDTPAPVTNIGATVSGSNVVLRWAPVVKDTNADREVVTAYQVYRSLDPTFASSSLIATVTPSNFGSIGGTLAYTDTGSGYYYLVRPINGAGRSAQSEPLGVIPGNAYARTIETAGPQTFLDHASTLNVTTLGSLAAITLTVYPGLPHPQADYQGGGAVMLNRYYDIASAGSDFTAALCLTYQDSEVPVGVSEGALRLCRWTGSGWSCPDRAAASEVTANLVCADGVTQFSEWTLGATGPTVVQMAHLTAAPPQRDSSGWVVLAMVASLGLLVWLAFRIVSRPT
ncbi:Amylopullulanase [Thermoflexales bacterium]|nr:Amylopullulanase [Thermoflexales bacterium]